MHTEIVIVAPIAGVPIDDIDISLARNIITISGDRVHSPLYVDARKTLVEECFYGAFSRSIILPENLAFDAIKAKMENHTLYIHIPKLTFNSANIAIERG
jgi:HSP20 family molecular chaperone IbpA